MSPESRVRRGGQLAWMAWAAVCVLWYLTIIGSVVTFAAFSYAMQHLDVAIVSLYTYINPVIAVALGTLVLGEPFHVRMLVAAAIILLGVVIVGPASRRAQQAGAPEQ